MIRLRLGAPLVAALPRLTTVALGSLALVTGAVALGERVAYADDETGVLSARHKTYESPQNFAFEVRVGPYHPRVDTASDTRGKGPYETEFGDSMRWEVAVEFDWQIYRIPHLGTIGIGASAGGLANIPVGVAPVATRSCGRGVVKYDPDEALDGSGGGAAAGNPATAGWTDAAGAGVPSSVTVT